MIGVSSEVIVNLSLASEMKVVIAQIFTIGRLLYSGTMILVIIFGSIGLLGYFHINLYALLTKNL